MTHAPDYRGNRRHIRLSRTCFQAHLRALRDIDVLASLIWEGRAQAVRITPQERVQQVRAEVAE